MKKLLFFTVSLALLVSCAKTVEIADGGKVESSTELTLNTIARQTRAVAEGTKVPTDNVIAFYPNFYSDLSSADFTSYNTIGMFGYDSEMEVWRNTSRLSPSVNPSRTRANQQPSMPQIPINYNFDPVYWPAGDRVFMDYVACSYGFLLTMIHNILRFDNEALTVNPVKDNANRMSVNYEYNMPEEKFFTAERPSESILSQLIQFIPMVNLLGFQTGIEDSYLQDFEQNYLTKYGEAINHLNDRDPEAALEPLSPEQKDALNRGYELYVNCYPVINKYMQDDLLYAHDRKLKNDNHGSVKATFNHSKAWIKVIVNNQTRNDIYVTDIRFNDVKSSGTLVIDNSKSQFETYWEIPQTPTPIGASIAAYRTVDLGGSIPDVPTGNTEEPELPGLVPDIYLSPAGCYGPAIQVDTIKQGDNVTALRFQYINGSKLFNVADRDCEQMVGRLSGMMFPAQEPGTISILCKYWGHDTTEFNRDENHIYHTLDAEKLWKHRSEPEKKITLNLPRQTWQMGKVYIYVLTISEDEITINPIVTEWQNADPVVGPEQTGMRTDDEATETFNSGDTSGWGF